MVERLAGSQKIAGSSPAGSTTLRPAMLKEIKGNHKRKPGKLFGEGFVAGMGWAFGVTIGFVMISTVLVVVLQLLGGLPLIGTFIASIVESTQEQLLKRTPLIPQ